MKICKTSLIDKYLVESCRKFDCKHVHIFFFKNSQELTILLNIIIEDNILRSAWKLYS